MRNTAIVLAAGLAGSAVPASAEVIQANDAGFVVRLTAEVAATPADAWNAFVAPAQWWSEQHTFSGDSANLSLDASANGCFCEKLPVPKDAPAGQKPGSVMHMRVVYAEPYRALRLAGGLGPLQSEAVNGTMTVTFKAIDGSAGKVTRILWEYVVGGFMRYKPETIAGAVDTVLAGQIAGLVKFAGPVKATSVEAPPAIVTEPVGTDLPATGASASDAPAGFTPDPTRDEDAAGASVKSALDKLFPRKDKPAGRR